jgi:hypothetical protein
MIDPNQLIDTSMIGIVVGWFMFRMEKVVNNNTEVLVNVRDYMKNGK